MSTTTIVTSQTTKFHVVPSEGGVTMMSYWKPHQNPLS